MVNDAYFLESVGALVLPSRGRSTLSFGII